MERNTRIQDILNQLAGAAASAADGVTDAVQTAGHVVSEKYDVVKLHIEINRLREAQKQLFTDIGRMMYLLQSGDISEGAESEKAEQAVGKLLLLADQKQQEIDHMAEKLHRLNGERLCAVCGKAAASDAIFCAGCGSNLS